MTHATTPARRRTCRTLLALLAPAALVLGSTTTATAETDPSVPQVQVVLPVVDGGITVVVSPGTQPAQPVGPATVPDRVPAQVPPPPGPAGPLSSAAPPPTSSDPPGHPSPGSGGVPTAEAPPSPSSTTDGTSGITGPGGPGPAESTPPISPSGAASPAPSWPSLPTARPTYVTPRSDPAPAGTQASTPTPPTGRSPSSTTGSTTDSTAGTTSDARGQFLFGVFAHSTDRTERFQRKIGRPVQVLGVFPTRGSWDSIMDTWWLDTAPAGFTGTLDVGVPLWQDDGDLSTAAAGGYDTRWETLGRTLHERYPGSSVRIGWEFNLGGWHHHATDENVEQWKTAFRKASAALKRGGPSLLVTWNPNKGRGDSLPDASKAWPGDDAVDIVGLDAYDWWPAYSESTWPEHRDGDQGWKYWVEFARSHGKTFAVPEWGVAPGNDHGGGDNPYYIGVVMDYLAAEHEKDGIVHSAVYFDEPEAYIANSIADGQVPQAGTALTQKLASVPVAHGRVPADGGAKRMDAGPSPTAAPSTGATPTTSDPPPADSAEGSPGAHRTEPEDGAAAATPPPELPSSADADEGPDDREWSSSGEHGPVPR